MKRSLLQKLSNVDHRKTYLCLHPPNKSQPRSFNGAINGAELLHPLCMDTELGWLFRTSTALSYSHACKLTLIPHIFDYLNMASIPIKVIYSKNIFYFCIFFQYPTISLKISKEYGSRRTTDDDSNEEGNGTDVSVESGISNTTATNLSGRRRTGNAASTLLGNRGIFCHK